MKRKASITVFITLLVLFFAVFVMFYLHISRPTEKEKTERLNLGINKGSQTKFMKAEKQMQKVKPVAAVLPDNRRDYAAENNEIKALIVKLGSDDLNISLDAAQELYKLGKSAIPDLLEALKQADIALKGQIIFLLGRIGDKDAVPALVQILADENAYIRRNAAEALGKIKNEGAISSLATSLFDGDIAVRERSAWALGEIRDARAVESLLDRMIDEKDGMVKTAAVISLGKIQDQRATQVLLRELKSQANSLYKNEVVKSLGELKDPSAIKGLSEHLNLLKQYNPTEKLVIFQWQEAIKITEEAISKIQNKSS